MLAVISNHIVLPILFFTGLTAGTVDAIAGGGGLISLPVLLAIGVPPHIALGTNKLQGTVGTLVATWRYHKGGWISFKYAYLGLISVLIGAAIGAISSQLVSSDILKKIIPVLLLIILLYTIFIPKNWGEDREPRLKPALFYSIFGFILGFYDGFFGPGTGAFWVFLLTFFMGYNLTKATAYTKILNLDSNLVALICFIIGNNIDYGIGLCMATGQLIGGHLGSHLAMRRGAAIIKPVFILMVLGTIGVLIYRNFVK